MVDAHRTQIARRLARHQCLERLPDTAVVNIYRNRWVDFREVLTDKLLDIRIQEPRWNNYELGAVSCAVRPANTVRIGSALRRSQSYARRRRKNARIGEQGR